VNKQGAIKFLWPVGINPVVLNIHLTGTEAADKSEQLCFGSETTFPDASQNSNDSSSYSTGI
jgi:hypothetical protein